MTDLFSSVYPEERIIDGVRYIREDLALCKPAGDVSGFDAFWNDRVPKGKKNGSKQDAKKAWGKLTSAERVLASERVAAFYSLTKEERIGAQEMHVSRYLNSRAFNEEVLERKLQRKAAAPQDKKAVAVNAIKSGKPFLCTHITDAQARTLVSQGLVTVEQCRAVGLDGR
jgi:hypothetical protein